MTLPSSVGDRTTEQVGYFEYGTDKLADWLSQGLGPEWKLSRLDWGTVTDAVTALVPLPVVSRYSCIPLGDWSLLLNNTPLGTDVGVIPSLAARELGCRAIRAVSTGDHQLYPARIIEIYGPEGSPPLAIERSIAAANDGGRWVFETSGEPLPFEDLDAYRQRIKARRLTHTMVIDYLRALGVPVDKEPDWNSAILIERRGTR